MKLSDLSLSDLNQLSALNQASKLTEYGFDGKYNNIDKNDKIIKDAIKNKVNNIEGINAEPIVNYLSV